VAYIIASNCLHCGFLQLDFTISAMKKAAALQNNASLLQSSQLLHLGIKLVPISSHADVDAAL
jgi:hypothetical protein